MSLRYVRGDATPDGYGPGKAVMLKIPSGEEFVVDAMPLAHFSKYFRTALNSAMEEAKTLKFHLTEHATREAVQLFVAWLYQRSHVGKFINADDFVEYLEPSTKGLLQAWLLGDYFMAAEFTNFVMSLLCEEPDDFDMNALGDMWETISPFEDLRRLVINLSFRLLVHDGTFSHEDRFGETLRTAIGKLPLHLWTELSVVAFQHAAKTRREVHMLTQKANTQSGKLPQGFASLGLPKSVDPEDYITDVFPEREGN
ncbi:hypothetical protein F4780DRAFT_202991 [Xylariomycetidae sp. FL0641]|nr:hypothetical protein F4780DRAFT_202991 [Xylariomycetidae sp. FL0641]